MIADLAPNTIARPYRHALRLLTGADAPDPVQVMAQARTRV